MPKPASYPCADCGAAFGSQWARSEHARSCPVTQSAELRRLQAGLESRQHSLRVEVEACYRYAARAFAAHHEDRAEEARRFLTWLTEDFERLVANLTTLGEDLASAGRTLFPRLESTKREVGTLIEQARDLRAIAETLTRLLPGRPS